MTLSTTFNSIYKTRRWVFGSGTGAVAFNNRHYIRFLQNYLDSHDAIRTVLDVGCGDWQIGRKIDWKDKHYLGIDVSDFILEQTREKYQTENVSFRVLDAAEDELPEADLVIVKDVLEHLSNATVSVILNKLNKYPYVIIQNDIAVCTTPNIDIDDGGYRKIDITKAPFHAHFNIASTYVERHLQAFLWVCLLITFTTTLLLKSGIPFVVMNLITIVMSIKYLPLKGLFVKSRRRGDQNLSDARSPAVRQ